MTIEAVVFDVGETLIDETRIWIRWAARLGVTPFTLLGMVGAMAALDRSHTDALKLVKPDFDLATERERWAVDEPDSLRDTFDEEDLYPDVRPALDALEAIALSAWIAGNQPVAARQALMAMELPVRSIINSSDLGAEKPDPRFFDAVAAAVGLEPAQILYVGDRLDNDVLPALAAGMRTVLMRRGPWGYLHATRPDVEKADAICDSLLEVPAVAGSL
ncbi:MAG TPA: HAD family hydrolase [Acidimicrobiia bacterium]|jgi:HAD superfamily hydrolase (TIGR01549 family)